jgi:hypothetical protein
MQRPSDITYRQPLGDGLVLRTGADARDVERVAAFNGIIHGDEVRGWMYNLFTHHPCTRAQDLIFVEEEENGEVVSSLCLIPWTWRYGSIEIAAGEMGAVGTLEAYRGRGLVRAQAEFFKQRLHERGCLLSQIQGIPYFYRQFGYEYALPLEGGLRLELRDIPTPPVPQQSAAFTFRLATEGDIPVLQRLYDEAARDLSIHAARDEAIWRFLLTDAKGGETECQTWLIEDAKGQVAGYIRVPEHHFGQELVVNESSRLGFDAALAALGHLKKLTLEREKPGIRLNLPAECTLMRLARSLGAYDMGTYAWQIHIPNVTALLRTLAPVLEERVAGSPFAGLTREVRLSLYREAMRLRFENGRVAEVASTRPTGDEALRVPPLQFTPLVLGYRTVEQLQAAYPDVSVTPVERLLIDTLFPTVSSFIYTIY